MLSQDKKDPPGGVPETFSSQEFSRTNSSLPDFGTTNSKLSLEDPLLDLRQNWSVPSSSLVTALGEMEGKWSSLDSGLPW